jgi:glutamyl-tRNA synthetase
MAMAQDAALLHELTAYLAVAGQPALTLAQHDMMLRGMYCLKDRAKTFPELLDKAAFIMAARPILPDPAAAAFLDTVSRGILHALTLQLQNASWKKEILESILTQAATAAGIGFGKLASPVRAALAGRTATPSVYDMMLVLGRDETLARLSDACG